MEHRNKKRDIEENRKDSFTSFTLPVSPCNAVQRYSLLRGVRRATEFAVDPSMKPSTVNSNVKLSSMALHSKLVPANPGFKPT